MHRVVGKRWQGCKNEGEFNLKSNEILALLVGQAGGYGYNNSNSYEGGGGGGTFVINNNSPLLIAGGGGGESIYGTNKQVGYLCETVRMSSLVSGGSGDKEKVMEVEQALELVELVVVDLVEMGLVEGMELRENLTTVAHLVVQDIIICLLMVGLAAEVVLDSPLVAVAVDTLEVAEVEMLLHMLLAEVVPIILEQISPTLRVKLVMGELKLHFSVLQMNHQQNHHLQNNQSLRV